MYLRPVSDVEQGYLTKMPSINPNDRRDGNASEYFQGGIRQEIALKLTRQAARRCDAGHKAKIERLCVPSWPKGRSATYSGGVAMPVAHASCHAPL
jgi:hypothetical protein